jgi:hypothetical protein
MEVYSQTEQGILNNHVESPVQLQEELEVPVKVETQEEKYEKILDCLLKASGGKEYCLRQVLTEFDYNQFSKDYRQDHRQDIYNRISERFYQDGTVFDEGNIADIEISKTCWNKFIMKLYFYDTVNYKLFEYYIKTDKIENTSLFEDNDKVFSKSFFPKMRNGNALWDEYKDFLEKEEREKEMARIAKDHAFFKEQVNKLKHLDMDEFDELNSIKAPDQYRDGCVRYLADNHYYYLIVGVDGYLTFEMGEDLLLNRGFSSLFYKKVVQKLRKNDKK